MVQKYNNPAGGTPSSVGVQFNTAYWDRRALIEARQHSLFSPLADTRTMPRHYGKQIEVFHYLPILDDRNINDQGIDANGATISNGNLYGSSKDIGKIVKSLPVLSEEGGRVNRVGNTRIRVIGSIGRMGIFREFTNESMIFDTDSELRMHQERELITAAWKVNEDYLQVEIIQAAETIYFGGAATKIDEVTGEGTVVSEISYASLERADRLLTNLQCPRTTRIITGSAFSNTTPIPACRVLYINSDMESTFRNMRDNFNERAFTPVEQYAYSGALLPFEIGKIGNYRIVSDPSVLYQEGAGAAVTDADTVYRHTNNKYDVYHAIIVGEESFTQVGLDGVGNSGKFEKATKMPGQGTPSHDDPYNEKGLTSIKWYYGFLSLRPERLVLFNTVARI